MIIDTHCHLNDNKFENPQQIIDDFELSGVDCCVCCGDSLKGSQRALELSQNEKVYCTLGVHPECADGFDEKVAEFIVNNATNPKVVAVGEIGLDYYHQFCERELQKEVFLQQIKLAYKLQLPMVIHIRDAMGDFIEILKNNKDLFKYGAVVHSFSGSVESAKIILDCGLYISFNGIATFKNANRVLEVIKFAPLERILVETDSPYLAPVPYRGQRNEPKYVIEVVKKISELKNMTTEELCQIFNANAKRLFTRIK